MLIVDYSRDAALRQDGFTLVEMLVGLSTGLVVMFAIFAMLLVTTNQTRLVTDRVEADRLGRQAMTHIVDELHSACIAREAVPVQSSSSETTLVFFNAYSEGAEIKSTSESKVAGESVYEHEISYEAGTKKLKEKVYPSTEVVLPSKVVFSKTPAKTITIAEGIAPVQVEKEKAKEKLPIFEYLKYRKEATDTANSAITSLEQIPLKGSETLGTAAATASGVGINFEQTPYTYGQYQGLPLQTQVTLALGSPNSETPIVDAPCD